MRELKGIASQPREIARSIFFLVTILVAFMGLASMTRISIPLVVAYVIYLITEPFIPILMKLGLNRILSILVVFVGIVFFAIYPIFKVVPIITEETRNLQYYIPKMESFIEKKYEKIRTDIEEKTGFAIDDQYLRDGVDIGKKASTNFLLNLPKLLASIVEWIFLVPLFVFFLLKDARNFRNMMIRICPNFIFERFYSLTHQFNKKIGGYIFAKFIEATIVGTIISFGLLFLDIKFSFLLGLVAGMTNIIPYVGPVIGAVPALIFALAEYGTGGTFYAIFLLYLIANSIDIAIVFPILVSKIVDLHPIVVVVSVILGSQYLGIIGMVISIPLAAALKLVILEIYNELYTSRIR